MSKNISCQYSTKYTGGLPVLTLEGSREHILRLNEKIAQLEAIIHPEQAPAQDTGAIERAGTPDKGSEGVHALNVSTRNSEFYGPSSAISFFNQISHLAQQAAVAATEAVPNNKTQGVNLLREDDSSNANADAVVINEPITAGDNQLESIQTNSDDKDLFSIPRPRSDELMAVYWKLVSPQIPIYNEQECMEEYNRMQDSSGLYASIRNSSHSERLNRLEDEYMRQDIVWNTAIIEMAFALALQHTILPAGLYDSGKHQFDRAKMDLGDILHHYDFRTVRLLGQMARIKSD